MIDKYGRKIEYLRLSVTDLCNLHCLYCMPQGGNCKRCQADVFTEDEMVMAVRAAVNLGIKKVRITGGEPLIKNNILSLCEKISKINGIEELCITTNGVLLDIYAKELKMAGVSRINISIDTLDEEKYRYITRGGEISKALKGLETAIDKGFDKIRINSVLMGGVNDDEKSVTDIANITKRYPVDLRFIELMPMIKGDSTNLSFVSAQKVVDILKLKDEVSFETVCRYYRIEGAKGNIGIITAISHKFCNECNRIRITADGTVKPCLHSGLEFSLAGKSCIEMEDVIRKAIENKPQEHTINNGTMSRAGRYMNQIGG